MSDKTTITIDEYDEVLDATATIARLMPISVDPDGGHRFFAPWLVGGSPSVVVNQHYSIFLDPDGHGRYYPR